MLGLRVIYLCQKALKERYECREAATDWGLQCMRYEIRDISPPPGVKAAMELQAEAERRKRAQVGWILALCRPALSLNWQRTTTL